MHHHSPYLYFDFHLSHVNAYLVPKQHQTLTQEQDPQTQPLSLLLLMFVDQEASHTHTQLLYQNRGC